MKDRVLIDNLRKIKILFLYGPVNSDLYGQHKVCLQDTVSIYIDEYRGQVSWQESLNGIDWTNNTQIAGDTLVLVANDPFYVRLEILDGNCKPYYSDILSVDIHEPPHVEFLSLDSVCIDDLEFMLEGGLPLGGEYFGPGVARGSFSPESAGVGIHELVYYFQDSLTTCSDTAYSQISVLPLSSNAQAGDDVELITSDTVQLQANTPDVGIGTWTVVSGEGGSFTDIHDPNAWFRKDSAQLDYELSWTIEGHCGANSDEVSLNFMQLSVNPCPGTPIVTDAEGNVYRTIQMGNQCWMAENLRSGIFRMSTATGRDHSDLNNDGITEKYCFDNDEANCELYGGLYDWHEAVGYTESEGIVQGVCPDGWHIPTNQDWADLDGQYKYGDAGEQLKETSPSGWGGQFAGDRHQRGEFYSFNSSGFFWSSTSYIYGNTNEGYFRKICACNGMLEKDHFNKIIGLSVRCIKDE